MSTYHVACPCSARESRDRESWRERSQDGKAIWTTLITKNSLDKSEEGGARQRGRAFMALSTCVYLFLGSKAVTGR